MVETIGGLEKSKEELQVEHPDFYDKREIVASLSKMINRCYQLEREIFKLKDGNNTGS